MNERPKKVRAGLYEYRGRLIIQTSWEGPKGGTMWRWEWADYDQHGEIVIEGLTAYRTLKQAANSAD